MPLDSSRNSLVGVNAIRHDARMNVLENAHFRLQIDPANGAVRSIFIKALNCDLIGEPQLAASFRLGLPLEDFQCHYIEGLEQEPTSIQYDGLTVTVRFDKLKSVRGTFAVMLSYTIALQEDAIV